MRSFHFPGRSPVYGRRAMCATSHPAASLTAIETLRAGGNAVDAAIATAAVLAVVECPMTGIGGDCFAILIAKPGQKKPIALNAAGRAPAGRDGRVVRQARASSASRPRACMPSPCPAPSTAGRRLLADHGTMPLERLLAPAIELAEGGFVVAPRVAADWADGSPQVQAGAGAKRTCSRTARCPRPARSCGFRRSPSTLKRIAKEGRDGFYAGEVAKDMVAELNALGGLHTLEDFAAQRRSYVTPISVQLSRRRPLRAAPEQPGHRRADHAQDAGAARQAAADPVSAERYHVLMEVARLAFAMRDTFVADPTWPTCRSSTCSTTPSSTSSPGASTARSTGPELGPLPRPAGSDTVYFSIVDEKGMAVSFINSLYGDFGTGIVTAKTGVIFHNRGEGFVLDPDAPQLHRPAQAAHAHAGAGHGAEGRQAADGLRRDGRALPAHGPRLHHDQHVRLRHGPAGGHRHPARVLRGRRGAGGGQRAGRRRRRT